MAQMIKIYTLSHSGTEIAEVTLEQAQRIVKEAYTRGSLLVDKRTCEVIDEPDPRIEELLIIDLFGGG